MPVCIRRYIKKMQMKFHSDTGIRVDHKKGDQCYIQTTD